MDKLEKLLFIFINFIFSASSFACFLIIALSGWLSVNINHANPIGENDGAYVGWIFLLTIGYWFSKLFLFPILFKAKKTFPYISCFLEKFKKERHFRKLVLKKALIIDLLIWAITSLIIMVYYYPRYLTLNIGDASYINGITFLMYGGGVLTSYIILLILFKIPSIFKKKKHLFYRAD